MDVDDIELIFARLECKGIFAAALNIVLSVSSPPSVVGRYVRVRG